MEQNYTGALSYETIANELFENYESIYNVNLATGEYTVYYESDSYSSLDLSHGGLDFFEKLSEEVGRVVTAEDRAFVLKKLSREELEMGVRKNKYYSLVYRIERDGQRVYHQLRATRVEIDGTEYALMGVRDVDSVMRQNAARQDELQSQRQKSRNYLEAILGAAAAYIDANLTRDLVLEQSSDFYGTIGGLLSETGDADTTVSYSKFQAWAAENLVSRNSEKFLKVSDRGYLLDTFERGVTRASTSFSIRTPNDDNVPCRIVFYLYREKASGDVHALCVIYDLTDEQRREKELEELKAQLVMSRIRSSASQMKPHFLYNVLGSIQEVILEDPERAADLLEKFTVHLRSCIKAMDSDDPIPFKREFENIKAYIEIERMRLGDRLNVLYELEVTDFLVLPLSIQPIVENAVRYGVQPRGTSGGTVAIRTRSEGDAVIVEVEDDGPGFDLAALEARVKAGNTESTGLKNISFRLDKILGASLAVESGRSSGTTVTVRIPKEVQR